MIKATARSQSGQPILILGLEEENWRRLLQGQPIRFEANELGLEPLTVVITGGRSERDLYEQLQPLFGPQTEIVLPADT